ncbi:uncharacterized [Tachysurus ichikawai]
MRKLLTRASDPERPPEHRQQVELELSQARGDKSAWILVSIRNGGEKMSKAAFHFIFLLVAKLNKKHAEPLGIYTSDQHQKRRKEKRLHQSLKE